ncbi:hypothetical protein A8713_23105 [Streptomyces sp. SAT1]|nr:hypothetical protein A8713_23105 [Streptomyces sp. SAT1]
MTCETCEYGGRRTDARRTAGRDGAADRRDSLSRTRTRTRTPARIRTPDPEPTEPSRRPAAAVSSADGALVEYHATEIPEQ